jgi:hypothetical protein
MSWWYWETRDEVKDQEVLRREVLKLDRGALPESEENRPAPWRLRCSLLLRRKAPAQPGAGKVTVLSGPATAGEPEEASRMLTVESAAWPNEVVLVVPSKTFGLQRPPPAPSGATRVGVKVEPGVGAGAGSGAGSAGPGAARPGAGAAAAPGDAAQPALGPAGGARPGPSAPPVPGGGAPAAGAGAGAGAGAAPVPGPAGARDAGAESLHTVMQTIKVIGMFPFYYEFSQRKEIVVEGQSFLVGDYVINVGVARVPPTAFIVLQVRFAACELPPGAASLSGVARALGVLADEGGRRRPGLDKAQVRSLSTGLERYAQVLPAAYGPMHQAVEAVELFAALVNL